jgi:hypothetical protein
VEGGWREGGEGREEQKYEIEVSDQFLGQQDSPTKRGKTFLICQIFLIFRK